jgi:hypothetical protein
MIYKGSLSTLYTGAFRKLTLLTVSQVSCAHFAHDYLHEASRGVTYSAAPVGPSLTLLRVSESRDWY